MITIIESSIEKRLKEASIHARDYFDVDTADFLVHPKSYSYYYTYGVMFKPRSILEFGVGFGYSLLSISAGSDVVDTIYGVDAELYVPGSTAIAEGVLRNGGYQGELNLIKSDIKSAVLPERQFDLVSLDCHDPTELALGWKYVADGGYCIIDDLGSSHSICEPNKFSWVLSQATQLVFSKQVEWYHFVDSFRGQLIIRKKPAVR